MSAAHIDLYRPDMNGGTRYGPVYLRVDLEDVRAANTLLVHYDFERDGWVLEAPSKLSWAPDEDWTDEQLEEVGFVPAWTEKAAAELDRINS